MFGVGVKIAIISDTHDNLKNLEKALSEIKKEKIQAILHCGDIFSPETLKVISDNFKGEIYAVISTSDFEFIGNEDKFKNLKLFNEFGKIEIDDKKIAFAHVPEIAKTLAIKEKPDIIFYGHTHKPWAEKVNKSILVNPGNLAGIFYKATFAIYDTEKSKLELKILERL